MRSGPFGRWRINQARSGLRSHGGLLMFYWDRATLERLISC
jgi:hypothetical protein